MWLKQQNCPKVFMELHGTKKHYLFFFVAPRFFVLKKKTSEVRVEEIKYV